MNEHDALLAAVLAEPREDGPRLALADWLMENGDHARGEFINVQCELARLLAEGLRDRPGCWCEFLAVLEPCCDVCQGWEDRAAALRDRELKLLGAHGRAWITGGILLLPSLAYASQGENVLELIDGTDKHRYTFRRGFMSKARCDWTLWRDYGDAILAGHPVERVELAGKKPFVNVLIKDRVVWFFDDREFPDFLPLTLMPFFDDTVRLSDPRFPDTGHSAVFTSAKDAVQAASAACLRFARSRRRQPASLAPPA